MNITDEITATVYDGTRQMAKLRPSEWRIQALRECPPPATMEACQGPAEAAAYWTANIQTDPHFNQEVECFVILILNTRRRIRGHVCVSTGLMDSCMVHAREVFRAAIVGSAHGIVLMHNHPSGESLPSEADIKITRDLIRAGQVLKIEVLDHVIMGAGAHTSMRSLGYCNQSP